jgi:hypothetical protein
MTQPDPGKNTRLVEIKGRTIVIKQLTDAQYALLARESQILQRDDIEKGRKVKGAARMFDVLESMVVQDGDRDFMTDQIAAGTITVSDMMEFVSTFAEPEEKPKVRRGRPPLKRA